MQWLVYLNEMLYNKFKKQQGYYMSKCELNLIFFGGAFLNRDLWVDIGIFNALYVDILDKLVLEVDATSFLLMNDIFEGVRF